MIWRRWNWLSDQGLSLPITPLLVVMVRICWLWPWLELARRWLTPSYPAPLLPLGSMLLLFWGGMLIARLALAQTNRLHLARLWVAGSGLLFLLCLLWWQYAHATYALWDMQWLWQMALELAYWQNELPPQFLTLLVAAGIWLRSVLDGQRQLLHDDVWSTFRTALVALVLLILVGQLDPRGLPAHTDRWMIGLFAVGLSALALSSVESSRITGIWNLQKQPRLRLNRYWLASVAVVITGVLAVGLILAAIFTPSTVASALSWISTLLNWLGMILAYLLQAVAYLIFLVLTPLIEWIQARLGEPRPLEEAVMPDFQGQFEEMPVQPRAQLQFATESFRWLGLAGVVIAIVVIFALALRYVRKSSGDEVEETRETVFTRELLEEQLASLWSRWYPRRRPSHAHRSPFLSLEGEEENRRAVRSLYQALLALAKQLGYPRSQAQTPTEYKSLLATLWPVDESAWNVVTEGYVAARYGLQAPSTEEVEQMRQAWSKIEVVLATQVPLVEEGPDAATDSSEHVRED